MWFCTGQAGVEFALFSWLRTACGATDRQRIFRFDFHAYGGGLESGLSNTFTSVCWILAGIGEQKSGIAKIQT
jgi:hypothetical protein